MPRPAVGRGRSRVGAEGSGAEPWLDSGDGHRAVEGVGPFVESSGRGAQAFEGVIARSTSFLPAYRPRLQPVGRPPLLPRSCR